MLLDNAGNGCVYLIQHFFLKKALANVVSYEYTIASIHPIMVKKLRTYISHVPYLYAHQPLELGGALYNAQLRRGGLKHE